MVQVCSKCSRANPKDACYCYHDGFVLDHGARNGGPLAIGAQVFQQPFVFPMAGCAGVLTSWRWRVKIAGRQPVIC